MAKKKEEVTGPVVEEIEETKEVEEVETVSELKASKAVDEIAFRARKLRYINSMPSERKKKFLGEQLCRRK